MNELKEKNHDLNHLLCHSKSEVTSLQDLVNSLKLDLKSLSDLKLKLENELQLSSQINSKNNNSEGNSKIKELNSKINSLESELVSVKLNNKNLSEKLIETNSLNVEHKNNILKLENNNIDLTSELSSFKQKLLKNELLLASNDADLKLFKAEKEELMIKVRDKSIQNLSVKEQYVQVVNENNFLKRYSNCNEFTQETFCSFGNEIFEKKEPSLRCLAKNEEITKENQESQVKKL